ncbi:MULTISPECIES: ATP-binding cassette domain-containing protein [unclassified Mycolicibacterium]|uniref:ATP-binding cassette domain-containing protein n=1 Tax=unclassified Mycolicibacterium TaxID=2636767 RepID=UPI001F4C20BB|nr:ATP-binding cassette domain-containing protein [Mycolicibacterium sp. YH-1]UNB52564.1 ATP-binding cassette domain-containing protein [Mycolicibacterium sp. YH-1]
MTHNPTAPARTEEGSKTLVDNFRRGLSVAGITKTFPGVTALDDVSFEAVPGEIHALVGGNGAGKSTLMAVASGALSPDCGTVRIGNDELTAASPLAAKVAGLAIAYQIPATLPDLTVAENLVLAVPPSLRPRLGEANAWAVEKLRPMGIEIDPTVPAGQLGLAEKQAIEICGALACEPSVLILDEPTEPFAAAESARLFQLIRRLSGSGVAVIYISHRLPDVFELADRITVLRDGQIRGQFAAADVTEDEIITLIAGRAVEALFPDRTDDPGEPAVVVSDFGAVGAPGVSTKIRRREILGLAGVEGNGQREFIRALGGAVASHGELSMDGGRIRLSSPRAARDKGIILMPQERGIEGIAPILSVRENLSLAALQRVSRGGFVSPAVERELAQEQVAELGVKTATIDTEVGTLSGGNQQKVVLGRALLSAPELLLCDEPTQGIDVGVRSEIYHRLRGVADSGTPVVVLSSDDVELAGLCDRVLVFSRGRVVRELLGDELTEHAITEASLTAGRTDAEAEATTAPRIGRPSRWQRLIGSQQSPSLVLLAVILGLGAVTTAVNGRFLSEFNIANLLMLMAPVLFLAAGQLIVMLTGGIDLSVGPLSGALVVVASFFIVEGYGFGWWILGFVLMFALAGAVGVANGAMVRYSRVVPVVATLITYTGLQGLSLVWRDAPGGVISLDVVEALNTRIGPFPIAVLIGVVVLVGFEFASRRTSFGLRLRASGSDEAAARKRGVGVDAVHMIAYLASSLLTAVGALLLMAQIGVGDPTAGITYTLVAITAVVLGGASIFGGRGSFIGVLFGVLLLQVISNATVFLALSQAWQYLLVGLMALAATAAYAQVQRKTAR